MVGNVYIASEKMIQDNPKLVEGFIAALIEGWQYAITYPDEAIDIVLKRVPELNREEELGILTEIARHFKADKRKRFAFTKSDFKQTQKILLRQKILRAPVDLGAAIEPRFVNDFHAR